MDNLYCCDCVDLLPKIDKNSINLIYIDPPFFTQRNFEQYNDRWKNLDAYLKMLMDRISLMKNCLKDTGSIYIHCDWHASHYIKVEMDKLFGYDNFRNEIIWLYGLGGSSKNQYPKKHDNIFWYTKSNRWSFIPPLVPATSNRMKGQNKKCPDYWNIPNINNMAKERIGYPTQKPEKLLERIIKASSNKGDLVADFFCGSGTTLSVAKKLNRRYLGCDSNKEAIEICRKRLNES